MECKEKEFYIEKLYEKHEEWLINKIDLTKSLLNVPVLILDCEKEFQNNFNVQQEMAQKLIEKFGVLPSINFKNKKDEIFLVKKSI